MNWKKIKLVFSLFSLFAVLELCLIGSLYAQVGPGNIRSADGTTSLVLWLRSDLGTSTTTDGVVLSGWNDQSGYGHNSSQGAGGRQPRFYNSTHTINGHPVIRFDGDLASSGINGDRLEIADAANLDNTSGLTIFFVSRATTLDGNPRGTISKRTSAGSNEAYSAFFHTSNFLNVDIANNARQNSGDGYVTSTSYISSFAYNNPNLVMYKDGLSVRSVTNQTTSIPNSPADLMIGQLAGNNSGYFAGDLAEVLIYREGLNLAEKTLIENYLSSRYNVAITNDRFGYEGTHGTDVFGIGQESDGSKTSNISNRFRATVSSFSNGTYIMFGHNNSAATLTELADLPSGNNARLERVWRVDYTGSSAVITAKFNIAGLTLGTGETFRILVDDDGTFGSGALQYAGTVSGDTLTVSSITLNSDVFLTLGRVTQAASTTYYSYQDGNWEDANTWTTDPSGFTQIPVGGQIPGDFGTVTILNGRTVTIPSSDVDAKFAVSTIIEDGGILDITSTTGHDFGVVSGQGTFAMEAVTFPTGNFTALRGSSGGTIEFKNVGGTLPSSVATFWNLKISNNTGSSNTIILDHNTSVNNNLEVTNTGAGGLTLQVGNTTTPRTIDIQGNTSINDATLTVGSANATHIIEFNGDLTNTDGIIDFVNGTGEANVFFRGASDNTVTLGGTLNQFYYIEIDKGVDQTFVLDINAGVGSNFDVTIGSGYKIDINAGTLKLSGSNISLANLSNGGNYDIGGAGNQNGALWVDGATITSNSAWVIYGRLTVSSGNVTIAAQGMVIRDDGEIIVEGGTLTVEKYRISSTAGTHRGSLTVTGGTFNIDNTLAGSSDAGYAAFSIPYTTQFFTMSGGTINVLYAEGGGAAVEGGIQINADPNNINVSGGTINVHIPTGTTDFRIASTAPFYNLNIQKTGTGAGNARLQDINSSVGNVAARDLVVINDFTLLTTGSPVFDANGFNVSVGGDFTVNTGASYTNTGGVNTISIENSILTGSESQHSITLNAATTFNNVTLSADSLITFAGSATPTISGNFSLESGSFTDNGKNIPIQGNVILNGTHSGAGSLILQGASLQNVSGTGTFQNLTLNNANNAQLSSSMRINGNLRLASGIVDATSFGVFLGESSAIYDATSGTGTAFSATKMIQSNGLVTNGGVSKGFSSAGGSFTFPIGTAGIYTPFTANITNADGSAGTVVATPVSSEHPNVSVSGSSLSYYWKVDTTGFGASAAGTYSFVYDNSDINGTEANYVYGDFDISSATWTAGAATDVDESTNTIGGAGTALETTTNLVGQFTAGEVASFGAVTVYYSRANGDWNTASTWSNASHTGAAAASPPGASDFVIIGDGATNNHSVHVLDAGSASASILRISQNSSLDLRASTGNTFTTVLEGTVGFGTLRINSSNFPGGDWSDFVATNGGTVQFYTDASGNLTLPASQTVYNNLSFVNDDATARTITLPAVGLTVNGNFLVGSSSNVASLDVATNSGGAYPLNITGNVTVTGVSGANTTDFIFSAASNTSHSVNGTISIDANSTFSAQNSGSTIHTLTLLGNISNAGILDLYTGTTNVNVVFSQTATQVVSGAGATYDFSNITVNKGSNKVAQVQINAANATVSGTVTLTNGSLRLTSSSTITLANNTAFTIPSTTELFIDGSTAQIIGTGYVNLVGRLRIDSGTLNVGTTNQNNYIEYSGSGTPELVINGGSITVASQIRRSTLTASGNLYFTQTGGTLTVADRQAPTNTRGVFEVLNSGRFDMSGGTIIITRPQTGSSDATIAAAYIRPGAKSVSGGLLQLGGPNTPASQTIRLNSSSEIYNLEVNTTNSPTAKLNTTGLVVLNNITIETGTTFLADGFQLTVGNTFSNSGTFTTGSNTVVFNGATPSISGSTTFYNLTYTSTGTLSLSSNITVSNNLVVSVTGTIVTGTNTITLKGNVTNNGSITSTTGELLMDGLSSQSILGNGNGIFNRLHVNNAAGIITFNDIQIADRLQLTNGNLGIGSFLLNITSTSSSAVVDGSLGTTFSTSNMILVNGSTADDGVTKSFPTGASNFTYPIGTSLGYTPVSYTFSSNSVAGTINVQSIGVTISARTDDNADGADLLDHYWDVTTTGFGAYSVTHTYTYLEGDVQTVGATTSDADYFAARFNSSTWTSGASVGSINNSTNVITIDGGAGGVAYLNGSYTAGATEEFGVLSTYYSRTTGNWETPSTWSTVSHGGAAAATVPSGNVVLIDASHTVTITANSKSSTSINLDGTLIVGSTTSHNFGTITGTGVMSIASSTFPGGDFSSFTSNGGGTIQLAGGTYVLPTQVTYNNLVLNTAGTKTLPNVNITVNGNLEITTGTLNASTFNRTINLYGNWSNTSSSSAFTSGSSTLVLLGTSAQNIGGTFATTFGNITVSNAQTGNQLGQNITVNGTLNMSSGRIDLNGRTITMGTAATLSEGASNYVYSGSGTGSITIQTRNLGTSPGNVAGLGFEIVFSGTSLGNTVITRYHSQVTENGLSSILRWFSATPTTNSGLNATLRFRYLDHELNGNDESTLSLYRKPTAGAWIERGGTPNSSLNYVQLASIDAFSEWTLDNGGSLPIELSFANATFDAEGTLLEWQTFTEFENYGFDVERITPESREWNNIGFVAGAGTVYEPQNYSYIDTDVKVAGAYSYRLKQIDYDGTFKYYPLLDVSIDSPDKPILRPNYPNPFNPTTTIPFELSEDGRVDIRVYDLSGREIAQLVESDFKAGRYSVLFVAQNVSSGTYIVRMVINGRVFSRKILLLK